MRRNFLLVTRYFLLVTGYFLLITRYFLLFASYVLLVTRYDFLVTRCYLPIKLVQYCIMFTMFTLNYTSAPEKENTSPNGCFSSVGRYCLL